MSNGLRAVQFPPRSTTRRCARVRRAAGCPEPPDRSGESRGARALFLLQVPLAGDWRLSSSWPVRGLDVACPAAPARAIVSSVRSLACPRRSGSGAQQRDRSGYRDSSVKEKGLAGARPRDANGYADCDDGATTALSLRPSPLRPTPVSDCAPMAVVIWVAWSCRRCSSVRGSLYCCLALQRESDLELEALSLKRNWVRSRVPGIGWRSDGSHS
jgi:hypothetical protein